jgi:Fe-S-cluster-containing dehydrogenase component
VATVDPRKCVGCRLCEQACGWGSIYIDPPREMLKRAVYPIEILTPKKGKRAQEAVAAAAARSDS